MKQRLPEALHDSPVGGARYTPWAIHEENIVFRVNDHFYIWVQRYEGQDIPCSVISFAGKNAWDDLELLLETVFYKYRGSSEDWEAMQTWAG